MRANDFNFLWFPELWHAPPVPPDSGHSPGLALLGLVAFLVIVAYSVAVLVMLTFGVMPAGAALGLLAVCLLAGRWTGRLFRRGSR